MAWSEGKNILGRGHRRDKDSEGLGFNFFLIKKFFFYF